MINLHLYAICMTLDMCMHKYFTLKIRQLCYGKLLRLTTDCVMCMVSHIMMHQGVHLRSAQVTNL